MSEHSEGLLGVTGVIRPRPDETSVGKADELLESFRRRARAWVTTETVKAWSPPSSHGFSTPEALRERLIHTPEEPEGVHEIGDEVLGAEWVAELTDAREQLVTAWPAVVLRGGGWEDEAPLPLDRAADWLALVAVIEDPLRLLVELESLAVVPAQLAIFESVYPDLHAILTKETFDGVVDLQVKKRELSPARERAVRLVLKSEPDAPIIVPPAEEPPPEKPRKSDGQDTRTVAQKAASAGEG